MVANTSGTVSRQPVIADETTRRAFTHVSSSSSSAAPSSSSTWANTSRREFGHGGKRADDQVSTSCQMSTSQSLPPPSPQTLSSSQCLTSPSPCSAQPQHAPDVLLTPTTTLSCSSLLRPQDGHQPIAAAAPMQVPSGPIFEIDLASCDEQLAEVCDDSPVFDLRPNSISNKQG